MTALISRRGQSLDVELPRTLPSIEADADRIKQVVTNLLNNAVKFTPKKGKITLRAKNRGRSVVIEVRDTGRGISEEDQTFLFKPYQHLASDKGDLSGLGIGLSLCKTLVELHGGKIWVKSRVGQGSTFSFSLPLKLIIQKKPESEEAGKPCKVLMIEDDQGIVDSVSVNFRLHWPEAQLIATSLGEEGIELAKTINPDIIILDIGLPDTSGFNVLKQIRLFSSIPIVILSVRVEEADIKTGLELGANDYIAKPFRQMELLKRLTNQLPKPAVLTE